MTDSEKTRETKKAIKKYKVDILFVLPRFRGKKEIYCWSVRWCLIFSLSSALSSAFLFPFYRSPRKSANAIKYRLSHDIIWISFSYCCCCMHCWNSSHYNEASFMSRHFCEHRKPSIAQQQQISKVTINKFRFAKSIFCAPLLASINFVLSVNSEGVGANAI